ncbi:MAG TPA: PhoH family protein [bacterium]|nr:PhoH family protein [bacterium]
MNSSITRTIPLKGADQLILLGFHDEHLHLIEKAFPASVVVRGELISITGEEKPVHALERLFTELLFLVNRNGRLDGHDVRTVINMIKAGQGKVSSESGNGSTVILYGKKGVIRPRSAGQTAYVTAVNQNDIVFAIGPAGTGKTYLAVAQAVARLREKAVSRIILTRPAIEAGESLGYLPGDLMEKVDPYLRPLTDALFDMIPSEQLQKYVERKIIEIVPLAYMRGRTLNDAFVILDEAQNTSTGQMKMFLTRLGINARAIVTGDTTQIDLSEQVTSGLVQIQEVLLNIEGIAFVYLDKTDVVRHRLVKDIIEAYEQFQNHSCSTGDQSADETV